MTDWTAPFKLPKLTSEQFRARRDAYIAKYGYTITIPGFEDIIKVPIERPVTIQEQKHWRAKNWDYFSDQRRDEIAYLKKRRKEKFMSMLGSATPDVFRNHASLMTAADDCQDALSTIAVLGVVAAKVLPRSIAPILEGPVGWTMIASEIFNAAMAVQRGPMMGMAGKRAMGQTTELNPFTKTARAKRVARMKRILPTKGDVIQGLQVTDQIFGVGISLGMVMNLPIEIIAGNVRRFAWGKPVTVKYPIPDMGHWYRQTKALARGIGLMWGTHHGLGQEEWVPAKYAEKIITEEPESPGFFKLPPDENELMMRWGGHRGTVETELTSHLIGYNMMNQIERAQTEWDPVTQIGDIGKIEIRAPGPEDLITLEIYEEEGLNPDDFRGWPGVNKEWATLEEIHDATAHVATNNLRNYCIRNKSNFMGMIGAHNAVEGSLVQLGNLEGEDAVDTDYTCICKSLHALMTLGYYLPQDATEEGKTCFVNYLQAYQNRGICPSTPQLIEYAEEHCGMNITTTPPEW